MSRIVINAAAALAVACIAAAAPAQAETQVNATGACKSALPVFDGNIRSRPLGVRNEGDASAFVSCSLPAEHGTRVELVGIYLSNSAEGSLTINCTMVNGRNTFGPEYDPQSMALSAGASGWMLFMPSASGPQGGDLINFSCNLPPGAELNMLATVPGGEG